MSYSFVIPIPNHRKDFLEMLSELSEIPLAVREKGDMIIKLDGMITAHEKPVSVREEYYGEMLVDTSDFFQGAGKGYCPFVLWMYSLLGEIGLAFRNVSQIRNVIIKDVKLSSKLHLMPDMSEIASIEISIFCKQENVELYASLLGSAIAYCPLIKILPTGVIKIKVTSEEE